MIVYHSDKLDLPAKDNSFMTEVLESDRISLIIS